MYQFGHVGDRSLHLQIIAPKFDKVINSKDTVASEYSTLFMTQYASKESSHLQLSLQELQFFIERRMYEYLQSVGGNACSSRSKTLLQ